MISLELTGNLGRDCETKAIEGGKTMIRFSVAASYGKDKTIWVGVSLFKDAGKDGIAHHLKKGTRVFLRGVPSTSAWTSQDGTLRSELQLTAYELELLGSPDNTQ
jgi:single-stranded DNA-binding protein